MTPGRKTIAAVVLIVGVSASAVVLASPESGSTPVDSRADKKGGGSHTKATSWRLLTRPFPSDRVLIVSIPTPGVCDGSQREPEIASAGVRETDTTVQLTPRLRLFPNRDRDGFCAGVGLILNHDVHLHRPIGDRLVLDETGAPENIPRSRRADRVLCLRAAVAPRRASELRRIGRRECGARLLARIRSHLD